MAGRTGYYKAAGVGSGITGRRFDVGIIDDPVKDRESANSPTMREAVWRWYTSTFSTRKAKDAGILLTLTRWHEDDLAGRLLKLQAEGRGDKWEVLKLPALATPERHPEDPREIDEPLWPWFCGREELERQRDLEPRDFWALYQQDPRAEGDTEWPESYFNREDFWFDQWPPLDQFAVRTVAIDPSKGKDSKVGDFQAIVRYGRTHNGTEWVEADLLRCPVDAMCDAVAEACKVFRPDGLLIESNSWQELLAYPMREAFAKAHVNGLTVHMSENMVSKPVRIRRLTDPLARRCVRFKRGSPGTARLVQQMRDFPIGDHDDGPDALEQARRLALELVNGKPKARR